MELLLLSQSRLFSYNSTPQIVLLHMYHSDLLTSTIFNLLMNVTLCFLTLLLHCNNAIVITYYKQLLPQPALRLVRQKSVTEKTSGDSSGGKPIGRVHSLETCPKMLNIVKCLLLSPEQLVVFFFFLSFFLSVCY